MHKNNTRNIVILATVVLLHTFLVFCLYKIIYPVHYLPQNLFLFDLIDKKVFLPTWILYLFDVSNLIVIWLIGKKLFNDKMSFIPLFVWVLSPWGYYLTAAGSFYTYLLSLVLSVIYCVMFFDSKDKVRALVICIVTTIVAVYSSFLIFLTLPIFFVALYFSGKVDKKYIRIIILTILISVVPLILLTFRNQTNFKNLLHIELGIYSNPDLVNGVNQYQGAAQDMGFRSLARISQNKYLFFAEYASFKYIRQFTPSTFFTSNEKLLKFSFSSPIFLGFIIPFIYGLYYLLGNLTVRKFLFISTILTLPSILADGFTDLNHLIIFAPVMILIISYGIILMLQKTNDRKVFMFMIITSILIIFQTAVTISDIKLREKNRFTQYFGQLYSLGNQ